MTNRNTYLCMPFCSESPQMDFYKYSNIKDLSDLCKKFMNNVLRCRTVGVIKSEHGQFYLLELGPEARNCSPHIKLSLDYLKTPVPSTIRPYTVQVFGFLQWINGPVIFVKVIQVLNTKSALRIKETMDNVVSSHLARNEDENTENQSESVEGPTQNKSDTCKQY